MRHLIKAVFATLFILPTSTTWATIRPEFNNCLSCRMRVLTPLGYVELNDLKVGDTVFSWDHGQSALVENKIKDIHFDDSGAYGDLFSKVSSQTVEVSPGYPFFLPEEDSYRAISDIQPDEKLLSVQVERDQKSCVTSLTQRGDYQKGGIGPVKSLFLEGPPDNIIVEGFVIHAHITADLENGG